MAEKVGRKNVTQRLDELRGDQVWHRIAADAEALGFDARIRTQIGRLVIKKLLSPTQAQAADLIARIYGRWERLHERKRSCRSPSYEFSTAGASEDATGIPGHLKTPAEIAAYIKTTEDDYSDVQRAMPPRRTSEARDAIETLCVEDRAITGHQLNLIYPVLNEVSVDFGLGPDTVGPGISATRSVPRIPGPRGRPPKRTRQERVDRGEFAARTDDAKPQRPSHLTGDAAQSAQRDREGLERMLLRRQAEREKEPAR